MIKADEKLEDLISHLRAVSVCYNSGDVGIEEVCQILTALKSENRDFLPDKEDVDNDVKILHSALDKLILNEVGR